MSDLDAKIRDIQRKLQVEQKVKEAAQLMRTQHKDRHAIEQCDQKVLDAQKRLDYLQGELSRLNTKRMSRSNSADTLDNNNNSFDPYSQNIPPSHQHQYPPPHPQQDGYPGAPYAHQNSPANYQQQQPQQYTQQPPPIPNSPSFSELPSNTAGSSSWMPKLFQRSGSGTSIGSQSPAIPRSSSKLSLDGRVKSATNLDLIKSDSVLTPEKVTLKLHEMAFKLDVELKVKKGTENLTRIYNADPAMGDKKDRAELFAKQHESNEKILLLKQALQKYQGLYVGEDDDDEEDKPPSQQMPRRNPGIRRPMTGNLFLRVLSAQHLSHAPRVKITETHVVVKIDGVIRGKTKPVKGDGGPLKWNEDFEIQVDRASEIEITVYDKLPNANDTYLPIGLLWIKIGDIAEELRTKMMMVEGWAPASGILGGMQKMSVSGSTGSLSTMGSQSTGTAVAPADSNSQPGYPTDGTEGWWDMEPVGQIGLKLNFVETGRRRQASRLGRHGAVRKRVPAKEIQEVNGHKFCLQQFYKPMKCALCGDFLASASGYQCDDCKFTCHKKCYPQVVTKCISKAYGDVAASDEDKLNHRIPHRFEDMTNLSANWCCHCGYMLPLGRKGAKKCSECDVTCHKRCSHLVPDFCGMSMEMANKILREIRDAKRRKTAAAQKSAAAAAQPVSDQHPYATPQQQQPQSGYNAFVKGQDGGVAVMVQPGPHPVRAQQASYGYADGSPTQKYQASLHYDQQQHVSQGGQMAPGRLQQRPRKVGLDDFNFLAVLGKGNFGKVMLAEEKYNKELYAIKVLKKEFIIENDEVESTRSEKRVFQAANRERHPFLVGLHSCFQTETRVYFVMEYVSGGDLMLHIQREQFSERRAKFYACEVLLALEYFHKNNIVYRDLKLDNILLGLDGHIKIADYGLCKEDMGYGATTNTFCGTPEFMAPEILREQKYGRAVDWWAFGVLIYEMLLGQSPFRGDDEDEIFDAILEDEILYPHNMSRDSVSVLQKLLTRDPEKRLGSGRSDAEEIKRHPFFKGVDWEAIINKRIPPPFLPSISSATDTSNFDEEFTREVPVLTPVHTVLDAADQEEFRGFSYVATWV